MMTTKKPAVSKEQLYLNAVRKAEMCIEYLLHCLLDETPIKIGKVSKVKDELTQLIDKASSDG